MVQRKNSKGERKKGTMALKRGKTPEKRLFDFYNAHYIPLRDG